MHASNIHTSTYIEGRTGGAFGKGAVVEMLEDERGRLGFPWIKIEQARGEPFATTADGKYGASPTNLDCRVLEVVGM